MSAFVRVAKVGGSLFDFERLPTALRVWLDDQPGVTLLIAGGGPCAEFIRRADEKFAVGEAYSHQLCLTAMRTTAQLLAALLPEARLVESLAACQEATATRQSAPLVFDIADFASQIPETVLPRDWSVTSDSLAAHTAGAVGAHELVLFKSVTLPPNTNREQACASGLVDACFSQAAANLPAIRWVNLRNEPPAERPL